MSAEIAVHEGVAAALRGHAPLADAVNGVFDGEPIKASLPYAVIAGGGSADWSAKGARGREIRLAVTVRDAGERPARLRGLMADAEDAIEAMTRNLDGWRVASLVFLRSRVVRDGGQWAGVIEYRVRVLEVI